MKTTIRAELVAISPGIYTDYVFKNLNEAEYSVYRYITAVKCPNWQQKELIDVGDIGFLEYESVNAGDTYYDSTTGEIGKYQYTNIYFMKFVKEKEMIKENFKF